MFRRSSAIALPILVLAFIFGPVSARGSGNEKPKLFALIFGTVWDPDGHPLYGVTVKIRRADQKNEKKAGWETFSNHTGEFAQRLPVGKADYIVWADLKGYKLPSGRQLKPGAEVTVHIDNDERSDIGLHLNW